MSFSDKLFYWLFQEHPDRILELQPDLPADGGSYRFSAPALKERERRMDGLFLPTADHSALPAVILEAQMAPQPSFLRRLYAESAMLIEQEEQIEHWRVVVLCPHRRLNFGSPAAVAEFLRERVHWIELKPAAADPAAPPLLRALALLVQPEHQIAASSNAIRRDVAGSDQEQALADVIAATLVCRFRGRSLQQLCVMAGISLDEFTQSVAYREIFGQGELQGLEKGLEKGLVKGLEKGRQEGRQEAELAMTLRLLNRRCGPLSAEQQARICALPLQRLEALAEALLDFRGAADLAAWLQTG